MGFITFIADAGVVGWIILATGGAVIALLIERVRVLYFQYGMNVDAFTSKIQNLVFTKKIDEAIVTCAQLEHKPLARAYKTILEKADRDDETIFQAQDIGIYRQRNHLEFRRGKQRVLLFRIIYKNK